ncbi:hypothetical protein N7U49_48565 (plasmid) [Streptomyces sp. AD2-2]|nr:hypothetical protein N7U49_48565 [Streptomyces sp. AD2-2]
MTPSGKITPGRRQPAELAGTGRIESGRDLLTPALLDRIASALDCRLTVTFTSSSGQAPPSS